MRVSLLLRENSVNTSNDILPTQKEDVFSGKKPYKALLLKWYWPEKIEPQQDYLLQSLEHEKTNHRKARFIWSAPDRKRAVPARGQNVAGAGNGNRP